MTEKDVAALIVNGWALVVLFAWVWMLFMAVLVPIWMVGTLRRLNGIRKELRRWNDHDGAGVPARAVERPSEQAPIGARLFGH